MPTKFYTQGKTQKAICLAKDKHPTPCKTSNNEVKFNNLVPKFSFGVWKSKKSQNQLILTMSKSMKFEAFVLFMYLTACIAKANQGVTQIYQMSSKKETRDGI